MSSSNRYRLKAGQRSIEEIVVSRRILSESAPLPSETAWKGRTTIRPETMDLGLVLHDSVNGRSNSAGLHLPSIGKSPVANREREANATLRSQRIKVPQDEQQGLGDREEVFEAVVDYCRTLQLKVQELEMLNLHREHEAIMSSALSTLTLGASGSPNFTAPKQKATAFSQTGASSSGAGASSFTAKVQLNSSSKESRELEAKVKDSVKEIDSKVIGLRQLFRPGDPLVERHQAATKLAKIIRGWLARLRLIRYHRGVRDWKWSRCRQVVWLLEILLGDQFDLEQSFQQMKMRREMRAKYAVYSKWVSWLKQILPLKAERKRRAAAMELEHKHRLMRKVFLAFHSGTIGAESTKLSMQLRAELIQAVRTELSEKLRARGEIGIVLDEDVRIAVERKVCMDYIASKRLRSMKMVFGGFKTMMRMCSKDMQIAKFQWFKTSVGKCFLAWSDYVYMVSIGLDRQRWPGPRQYEVRYNRKRVEIFSRQRCLRFVLGPWIVFSRLQSQVKKSYQRATAKFVRDHFIAMRSLTTEQRRLRIMTIDNWKSYARLMISKPFSAWAGYVMGAKNKYWEHQRLAISYIRCKNRKWLRTIIKTWRHLAVYGRIDGLYTRKMLIDSLTEQKTLSGNLQKSLAAQMVELEQCRDIVAAETEHRQLLERQLLTAAADLRKQVIIGHHGDQERKRLEGIIDAIAIINPKQVKHLKQLQLAFQFRIRKVALSKLPEDYVDENSELTAAQDNEDIDQSTAHSQMQTPRSNIDSDINTRPEVADANAVRENKPLEAPVASIGAIGETVASVRRDEESVASSRNSFNDMKLRESISYEDKLLLLRVKWLLSRFERWEEEDEANRIAVAEATAKAISEAEAEAEAEAVAKASADTIAASAPSDLNGDANLELAADNAEVAGEKDDEEDDMNWGDDGDDELGAASMEQTPSPGPPAIVFPTFVVPQRPPIIPESKSFPSLVLPPDAPVTDTSDEVNCLNEKEDVDAITVNSSQVLFSLLEFIKDGNVSLLDASDRQDWIRAVVKMSESRIDMPFDQEDGVDVVSAVHALENINSETYSTSDINEDAVDILRSNSWRRSLVRLKTLYPDRKAVEEDSVTRAKKIGSGKKISDICSRLTDMRDNLEVVLARNERRIKALHEGIHVDEKDQLNLYAATVTNKEPLSRPSTTNHK